MLRVGNAQEQIRAAVLTLAGSQDLLAAVTQQASAVTCFIVTLTTAEHIALFNMMEPGPNRIYMAILYVEVTKKTRDANLEVMILFMLLHLADATVSVEQLNDFTNSSIVYGPASQDRFRAVRDTDVGRDLLRRQRLEYLHAAHEWLLDYIDAARVTVRSMASVFQPVLTDTRRNDAEHAASRAEVARVTPEVVAHVDRFAHELQGALEDLFGRADALRQYAQMQALTEASALAVTTPDDDAAFEQRVAYLLIHSDPRAAWETLQRFRSTVLRAQVTSVGGANEARPDAGTDSTTQRAPRFGRVGGVADPLQQFSERLRLEMDVQDPSPKVGIDGLFERIVPSLQQAAVIEYVLTDTETFAFVLRAQAPEPMIVRIPLGRSTVRRAVRELLEGTSRFRLGVFEQGWRISASSERGLKTLDSLTPLVRWIPDLLGDCSHVCVVPYGEIHALPLHAIPVAQTPIRRYLVETHSVSYVPAAEFVPTQAPRGATRSGRRALVAGTMLAHEDGAALDAHLNRIAALFDRAEILRSCDATPTAITQLAARAFFDVVYLHGHGRFVADAPAESGILLSDGTHLPTMVAPPATHALRAVDVASSDLAGDLCVLASCLSGRTRIQPGDEVLGLVRSLFVRRFRSAVTALWSFEVHSGRTLLEEFLAQTIGATVHRGAALAAIQRRMLYGDFGERWRHPYFWGAFVLLGDWR